MTTEAVNVQITDSQFKSMLSEAIMASLTQETRDALLREALASLLARQTYDAGYGKKGVHPSIVEGAFAQAVSQIGSGVVKDLVMNDPEIRGQAEHLIRDTLIAFMASERAGEKIATAIWSAVGQ